jgi:OOP family OmpA-OmpF porin
MKQVFILVAGISMVLAAPRLTRAQFGSIGDIIQNKVEEKVDQKVEEKTEEAMDSILQNHKGGSQPANTSSGSGSSGGSVSNSSGGTNATSAPASAEAKTFAAYNNYDFKPGENIIFDDNFTNDQDGEFPSHWDLEKGQAVVNKVEGQSAFLLTEGNYVMVVPRMKTESYLTDPFTVEFDYYQANSGQWAPLVRFYDGEFSHDLHFAAEVGTSGFPHDLTGNSLDGKGDYYGKWHHAAVIYKDGQMKAYVDNTRALVMPHTDFVPKKLSVGGIGDPKLPITFRNFRVAAGGSSNAIGKLLTDGKFVTHGITFDVGKASIKPESMGVLNEVATFLKSNGSAKFEIDGHTDSDGPADKNLKLSKDRADAVRTQLVAMGIDGSRLTTKGFGASKPIAENNSPEGKANNRRVEFIKQ